MAMNHMEMDPTTGFAIAPMSVANASGTNISAGNLIYVTGWTETGGARSGSAMQVSLANAGVSGARASMVAVTAIPNGGTGGAAPMFRANGVNTSAGALGDPVYLDTVAGGWTLVAPTSSSAFQQIVGRIAVVSANNGAVQLSPAMYMNQTVRMSSSDLAQAASISTVALAAGAVTMAKAKVFVSTVLTATGSMQNIAHGLGAVPSAVLVVPVDLSPATTGLFTATEGTHTATNVVVTVTASKTFKVMAWA